MFLVSCTLTGVEIKKQEPKIESVRRGLDISEEKGFRDETSLSFESGFVYTFFKPKDCQSPSDKTGKRDLVICNSEEKMVVWVRKNGKVEVREKTLDMPRNPYPVEIAYQWRYCPFQTDNYLESLTDVFMGYQDPDIGFCYILKDVSPQEISTLYQSSNMRLLESVHPYLADAIKRLIVTAKKEGIDVKVISGTRPYTKKVVWFAKKDKKKKIKQKKTVYQKGLHAWGLAVDINLMHRNDLTSAIRAYLNGKEMKEWKRIGEIGESYGLYWLGRKDPKEIFHFEWRPTWSGQPRGEIRKRIAQMEIQGGVEGVWKLLLFDPKRPTVFWHLKD